MTANIQKTCIVVTCFDENQPGYLDFSYRIQSLAKEFKLTVISQGEITQSELLLENVTYQSFAKRSGKLGWLIYNAKCAQFIRQQNPDVVVLLHSAVSLIALLVGKTPTCLYWNEHPTNLIHQPLGFSLLRKGLAIFLQRLVFLGAKKSTVVMPIGEDHQEDLLKHGVLANKMHMIYMGVSTDFLPQNNANKTLETSHDSNVIKLVYVGTVSESRGRDVMLDAMKIVADQQLKLHLTIVGASAEQLQYCEQRIQALSLQAYVKVIGKVSGNQVPAYLAIADVAICLWQASPWNQFNPPTKLFEYLVAGLPVLASRIRTHTRYIRDGQNGFIFEYNAYSLAKVLHQLQLKINVIPIMQKQALYEGEQYLWPRLEPVFLAEIRKAASA